MEIEITAERVEALETRIEEMKLTDERLRNDHREQIERLNVAERARYLQRSITEMQVRHLTKLAMRQRGTIGEVNQATSDDAYYRFTVECAFRIGRLMGFYSEINTFADELELSELWDRVYNDSAYTQIHDSRELYAKVYEIVREHQVYPFQDRHPMEADYVDLWREAYKVARQNGMCDSYELVAGYLGIPTEYELTYSGTVRVYVDGWFEFETSGTTADGSPDASEELYSVNISDFLDQIDMNAEWAELNFHNED